MHRGCLDRRRRVGLGRRSWRCRCLCLELFDFVFQFLQALQELPVDLVLTRGWIRRLLCLSWNCHGQAQAESDG